MTETKPRRRWFRFSLRTLFVLVTMICISFGASLLLMQFRIVQQRQQFVARLTADSNGKNDGSDSGATLSPLKNPDRTLSPTRRFFGDHNYSVIVLSTKYGQDLIDKAVALFPEAQIKHWQPVGPRIPGNKYVWISPVVIQK